MDTTVNAGRKTAGYSLLEIMVVLLIASIAILATGVVTRMSQSAIQTAAIQADLEARALIILDRIANELKDSGDLYSLFEITNDDGGSANSANRKIIFARCNGFNSGAPTFGARTVIQFKLIGNKLCLERSEDAAGGPKVQILCDNLSEFDPRSGVSALAANSPHRFPPDRPLGTPVANSVSCYGINFTRNGTVLTITVALQGQNFVRLQNKQDIDNRPFVCCQTQVQLKMMD